VAFAVANRTAITGSNAKAADALSAAGACGEERWHVKTLTDSAASLVNFHAKSTTVSALRRLRAPATLGSRNPGVERRTYRVRARLVEFKIEEDSDVHLVIADPVFPKRTMIVEFPATACTKGAAAKRRSQMARARSTLLQACGVHRTTPGARIQPRNLSRRVKEARFRRTQTRWCSVEEAPHRPFGAARIAPRVVGCRR